MNLTGTGTTQIWYDEQRRGRSRACTQHPRVGVVSGQRAAQRVVGGREEHAARRHLDRHEGVKQHDACPCGRAPPPPMSSRSRVRDAHRRGRATHSRPRPAGPASASAASGSPTPPAARPAPAPSAVGPTPTAGTTAKWVGAIATFFGSCGGGSLGLTAPSTATFTTTTLNGASRALTSNLSFTPNDGTGSESGWNLTGTSTTFTLWHAHAADDRDDRDGRQRRLAVGTCQLMSHSVTYPVTLPAATTATSGRQALRRGRCDQHRHLDCRSTFSLAVGALRPRRDLHVDLDLQPRERALTSPGTEGLRAGVSARRAAAPGFRRRARVGEGPPSGRAR